MTKLKPTNNRILPLNNFKKLKKKIKKKKILPLDWLSPFDRLFSKNEQVPPSDCLAAEGTVYLGEQKTVIKVTRR